jgi:hypothetical protein
VVLTYFGDHQPNLGGDVPLTADLDQPRYLTHFTIKGAGDTPVRGAGADCRRQFLGSLLLEHAGIPGDAFFAASAAMRQLCGGTLLGCQDAALEASYRAFLFHDLDAAGGPSKTIARERQGASARLTRTAAAPLTCPLR